MLAQFESHIRESLSFLIEKKLLVACSGGLDSVVLVYLMRKLDLDISLAHCNFSLRGEESDQDEEFVIDLADKLSIPVFTESFETEKFATENKISVQMAARQLRYQWFEELATDLNFDFIITGHHADDDMETFFINLSRGTGLRGLTGIPEINQRIVRPLKPYTRSEILDYAKKEKYHWREDSSNLKTDYLRNKLRIEVLPHFKNIGDSAVQSFQRTQRNLSESQKLVDDYMELISKLVVQKIDGGYSIAINKLRELPNTKSLLYELLFPYGFTAWEDISALMEGQSGKIIFSDTHRLIKDRDIFILNELHPAKGIDEYLIADVESKISEPIALELTMSDKIGKVDRYTIYIDKDKVQFPLSLRKWREGDSFKPFGMKGNKKLSKFFKDEKLSLVAKEKIWLLLSDNKVVWVVGMRADDRFKVTSKTKHILKISCTP